MRYLAIGLCILVAGVLIHRSPAWRVYSAADGEGLVLFSEELVIPDACRDLGTEDEVFCVLLATVNHWYGESERLDAARDALQEELDVYHATYTITVSAAEFEDGSLTEKGIQAAIGACQVVLPRGETVIGDQITVGPGVGLRGSGLSELTLRAESPVESVVKFVSLPQQR